MGVDEGNLQIIDDVDVILEKRCPKTIPLELRYILHTNIYSGCGKERRILNGPW